MPVRKYPIVTDEIYHLFNRSVADQNIFNNQREYSLFLSLIEYYRFKNIPGRFSFFIRQDREYKKQIITELNKKQEKYIEIFCFALMPNHYHILVKQLVDNGISNFARLIQNSYARYLNIKMDRHGSLFQNPFKLVRITSNEQFIHVGRYIHLNPLTSYVIKKKEKLRTYQYNSFVDYVSSKPRNMVNTLELLEKFKNKDRFTGFTFDNLSYQRELNRIKHLTFE